MAKNPNKSPEKGFQKELEKASNLKPSEAKKKFTWHEQVSDAASPKPMNTPRRMSRQSAASPGKSKYADEMAKHFKARKARS